MRRRLTTLLLALFALLPAMRMGAQTPVPKHEVRAVWLTTIGGLDWPHRYAQTPSSVERQKSELRATLDQLQGAGINTILLQTRIRATTIYPSAMEPWDGCLSGKPGVSPGYDALAFAIDEAHRRGMELHAWVVTMPVGKWNGTGCRRLRQRHPELLRRIGEEGYMNPELPATATYLADICAEIADHYDVDGIHLDYIRYPESWKIKIPRSEARTHITRIVRTIHDRVKRSKPWVKMSCSPVGKYDDLPRYWSHGWNARETVCQDAQAWMREGLMDALFPMMYFRDNQFFPFALDWKESACGRIVAPGLGIYFLSPKEKDWPLEAISRELHMLRREGMGHAYFRSKFLTDNVKGIYDVASFELCQHPALIPPMTWESTAVPPTPQHFQVTSTADGTALSWTPTESHSADLYYTYNIYASHEWPVDITKGENLVAIRQRGSSFFIADKNARTMHYAVTATDRYGAESPAAQEQENALPSPTLPMQQCGQKLTLPEKPSTLQADYLVIEDLAGRIVLTLPYTGKEANVSSLPDGIYTLRSLGRKGVTHRMGWVMKNEE